MSNISKISFKERLNELHLLECGWICEGKAFYGPDLDWLEHFFENYFPKDLPLPNLYPTSEGNVQAEWTVGARDISLDINLSEKTGQYHCLNLNNSLCDAAIYNLVCEDGRHRLFKKLSCVLKYEPDIENQTTFEN